jgi:bifunctional DNA-binding transcriptional regulator/antitoxin component of YhaV-PrlF toxin-antitoxin module
MRFTKRAREVGGSIEITIPNEICEAMEIEDGDIVELEVVSVKKRGKK